MLQLQNKPSIFNTETHYIQEEEVHTNIAK